MNTILQDEKKIEIFSQIQGALIELKPNSSDDEISGKFNLIPPNYLNQKDDLMIICQLFAYYARSNPTIMKSNSIKLFKLLLTPIKKHLNNESYFFWNIFGGLFYFKLWFYDEGIITIEQIILSAQNDETFYTSEYFYPEISEKKPEIFENETKYQLKKVYSKEETGKFKELRRKHINWLFNSGNHHDPIYTEIENDQLRLSIKRDDVDTFQKILSKTNMSINSKIQESIIENFYFYPHEISLIEFAIEFNAIQIIKFLILKNAELNENLVNSAIENNNYEIIHIIESKMKEKFESSVIQFAVWNNEVAEYIMNNYDYDFLTKSDVDIENKDAVFEIMSQTFHSLNFIFFRSTLLPFLRNNEKFVEKNIFDIVSSTFFDMSGHFTKEFLKLPNIDLNHLHQFDEVSQSTLLGRAIQIRNFKAFEILLENPNININQPSFKSYPPFHLACKFGLEVNYLEKLKNYPNFDINAKETLYGDSCLDLAISNANFYAIEFIFNNFNDFNFSGCFSFYFYSTLIGNHFLTLKTFLNYLFENQYRVESGNDLVNTLVETFQNDFKKQPDYDPKMVDSLRKILYEVKREFLSKEAE